MVGGWTETGILVAISEEESIAYGPMRCVLHRDGATNSDERYQVPAFALIMALRTIVGAGHAAPGREGGY
jgi:hypothetical protein